jgi:hypothetical protein
MTALFADLVRFAPTAGGTTDFVYSSVVQGYQSPAAGGMIDGQNYKYRAESTDLTQWEVGEGTWTAASSTLARTTVLYNSLGSTAKVNFTTAPIVACVALNSDIQNAKRTRTVLTSGSGTYTTPKGCKYIIVRLLGGGGGGGGGAGAGSAGGATTFGTSFLTANGGQPGSSYGSGNAGGGAAAGGDINITGGYGSASWGAGIGSSVNQGAPGASGPFGGAGSGGWNSANGFNASSNSGSGGGGGGGVGSSSNGGCGGGAAGGYLEKLITSPAASYAYAVGSGGGGGGGNANGFAGGTGGSGVIIIDEFY